MVRPSAFVSSFQVLCQIIAFIFIAECYFAHYETATFDFKLLHLLFCHVAQKKLEEKRLAEQKARSDAAAKVRNNICLYVAFPLIFFFCNLKLHSTSYIEFVLHSMISLFCYNLYPRSRRNEWPRKPRSFAFSKKKNLPKLRASRLKMKPKPSM
jgi:hypothetical protein